MNEADRHLERADLLERLADLHAGALAAKEERELRARIAGDDEAMILLAVLEQARGELADLGEDDDPGYLEGLDDPQVGAMPDDVAARIDAALAQEVRARRTNQPGTIHDDPALPGSAIPPPGPSAVPSTSSTALPVAAPDAAGPSTASGESAGAGEFAGDTGAVDELAEARRRRRRRLYSGLSVAAGAAVLGLVVGTLVTGDDTPRAGSVPAFGAEDLASAWPAIREQRDLGPLTNRPGDLEACLRPASVSGAILGAQPITFDGRPAVLVAAPDASSAGNQTVLVALDPTCGATNAVAPLARTPVGP